jgi:hypothetical protein
VGAVAVHRDGGGVVHGSWQAPETVPVTDLTPLRASSFSEGGLHLVSVPMEGMHLVVARSQGPAFHRAELDKISRLVGIVSMLARAGVTRTA